jgi:hypothetical protein
MFIEFSFIGSHPETFQESFVRGKLDGKYGAGSRKKQR